MLPIDPPPAPAGRSAVTIRRDDPDDARQRRIYARVDSGAHHEFRFGYTITVEVKPGQHALFAASGLFRKTIRFAVAPGEHANFSVISRPPLPGAGALVRRGWVPGRVTIIRTR